MQEECGCKAGMHGQGIGGHGARHSFHSMCTCGHRGRRFLSRKERLEVLEEYRESLKNELEGVEEAIKDIKKEV